MNFKEMFGEAKFVMKEGGEGFSFLRGRFFLQKKGRVTLRVVGLGFFECYINGVRVSEDRYLPLATDYEARDNYPVGEILTGHHLYVPQYDISELVCEGENVIVIHYGGGWYTLTSYGLIGRYGVAKAAYRIITEDCEFVSSEEDVVVPSYVTDYCFHRYEVEDRTHFDNSVIQKTFDDENFLKAVIAPIPETEYLISDCPADKVKERIIPTLVGEYDGVRVYDAGKNLSGVPVVKLGNDGRAVVLFSEELNADKKLNEKHCYYQRYEVVGRPGDICYPKFTWFGFRYFSVEGDAEVCSIDFIHTDLAITSNFRSDNEMLDWFYRTYLHTQLCNMHAGIPSDCPHLERQGYTGDGQLTCRAMMTLTDSKSFYRKWIRDIIDCQDTLTGHIQYTAPYFHCGGGPGAWGCAIVEVPYQYYKQYGDDEPARQAYNGMKRYFDYLEDHSSNDIVVSDKEGEWCLGDWCTYTQVILPAGFVNNYYYVRSLMRVIELAKHFGFFEDVPEFERRIEVRKKALMAAYYNTWDSNFVGGVQGANAFMLDIGLGNEMTYKNMVAYYEKLGHIDTGICGTEILLRLLFERGDGELAVKLLCSKDMEGMGAWYELGATTLWECLGPSARSHNHPMFGSPVTNYFDFLLGIQDAGEYGYQSLLIKPFLPSTLSFIEGERNIPAGKVSVNIRRKENEVQVRIVVPRSVSATLDFMGRVEKLHEGENLISIETTYTKV